MDEDNGNRPLGAGGAGGAAAPLEKTRGCALLAFLMNPRKTSKMCLSGTAPLQYPHLEVRTFFSFFFFFLVSTSSQEIVPRALNGNGQRRAPWEPGMLQHPLEFLMN